MQNNDKNKKQNRVQEVIDTISKYLNSLAIGNSLKEIISKIHEVQNATGHINKDLSSMKDNSNDLKGILSEISKDITKIKINSDYLNKIPTTKKTIITAIVTSIVAGLILTGLTYFAINPALNTVGRMNEKFGKFLRNSTLQGSEFTEKELAALISILPETPEEKKTPYIDFIPVGWRQIETISGDYGIRAAFIIENGNSIIKNLHILDEYYIRVEGLPKMEKWLTSTGEGFNREQEDALVAYSKKTIQISKEILDFFEKNYTPNMDLSQIQKLLSTGDINVNTYGQNKEYYFEPRMLRPNQKFSYEFGRSTGQTGEGIENAILDGTNFLMIISVVEYQGEDGRTYRTYLASKSVSGRDKFINTSQGFVYYRLVEAKEWNLEILKNKDASKSAMLQSTQKTTQKTVQ